MSARRGRPLNKLRYVSILHFQRETFPGERPDILCDARRERASFRPFYVAYAWSERKKRDCGRGSPVESISIWFIAVSAWISSKQNASRVKGELSAFRKPPERVLKAGKENKKKSLYFFFLNEANLVE